jgi:hypothetical protein
VKGLKPNDLVAATVTPNGAPEYCFSSASANCYTLKCPEVNAGIIRGSDIICFPSSGLLSSSLSGGTWSSSDPNIATIDPISGIVKSKSAGQATISYSLPNKTPNCPNAISSFIVTISKPISPIITINPATCLKAGNVMVDNYKQIDTNYTFSPNGPRLNSVGVIENAIPGTSYRVFVSNSHKCKSSTVRFLVPVQLKSPEVPVIRTTPSTCAAPGSITIVNYVTTGITYTFNPVGPTVGVGGTISNATPGMSYTVTAINSSKCTATSTTFVRPIQLAAPATPTVTKTAATCTTPGNVTISNYVATGISYTFSPTGPTVGAGGVISNAMPGRSYTVTSRNSRNCTATSSAFVRPVQLVAPATPTIITTVATCTTPGTATISNYVASGVTYTFTPEGPTVGAGGVINNATPGVNYSVSARNTNNCASENATFIRPSILATPTVSIGMATCTAPGTATVSNHVPIGISYTFSPTGPTVGAGGVISNAMPGRSYTVTSRNSRNCTATSSAFVRPVQLVTPATPTIITTVATCSNPGTATISNYVASGVTYTFTPEGPTVRAGGVINNATPGTSYLVVAKNVNGCTSSNAKFTRSSQLAVPTIPIISNNTSGGTFITNYQSSGISYSISPTGPTVSTTGMIRNLSFGIDYVVTATNTNGCKSSSNKFQRLDLTKSFTLKSDSSSKNDDYLLNQSKNNFNLSKISADSDNETIIFNLYPNPSLDDVTLKISEELLGNSFEIIDYSGRVILQGKIEAIEQKIDLSQIARGAYHFNVTNSNMPLCKLIKQ